MDMPAKRKAAPRKRTEPVEAQRRAAEQQHYDPLFGTTPGGSSYRRSSTPSGTSQPSVIRWDPPVYAALKEASLYSNTSMTVIANTAVANYLASPEVRTQIDTARAAQNDAIRKLSGE